MNPEVSTSTNRIVPKQNTSEQYQFDASGNMTRDDVGNTFTFDAENHQKTYTEQGQTQPKAFYYYDGDGKRVKKIVKVQSGQQTIDEITIFVYNGGGALVAEYTENITAPTNPQTVYLTADALGTPRINTNQKGEVVARYDYLPFGDEINIVLGQQTMGSRYGHSEYVPDDVRQKFTGYEKDEETGLDFAQARYYGNGLGRFTSVDPALESAELILPQSWNRYVYVLNNPMNLVDPDGLRWALLTLQNGRKVYEWFESDADYNKAINERGYTAVDFDESKPFTFTRSYDASWNVNFTLNPNGKIDVEAELTRWGWWTTSWDPFLYTWEKTGVEIDARRNMAAQTLNYIESYEPSTTNTPQLPSPTDLPAGMGPRLKVDYRNYPKQIHHFASNKNKRNAYTKAFEKIAKKYKLDLDGSWNKASLHHKGSHPKEYHEFVLSGMQRAAKEAGRDRAKFLELFNKYVKEPVSKDPGMLDKAWWK